MIDYMQFWFAKFLVENAFALIFLLLFLTWLLFISLKEAVKQRFCKHERYFENGRCYAICRGCGKNLGFIGTVRENERKAKND